MSASSPEQTTDVVGTFYGLSAIAEQVDDDNVDGWLAALVLLLAEELGDQDRVEALAREAALSITATHPNQEESS